MHLRTRVRDLSNFSMYIRRPSRSLKWEHPEEYRFCRSKYHVDLGTCAIYYHKRTLVHTHKISKSADDAWINSNNILNTEHLHIVNLIMLTFAYLPIHERTFVNGCDPVFTSFTDERWAYFSCYSVFVNYCHTDVHEWRCVAGCVDNNDMYLRTNVRKFPTIR
jgi:hypothetical protein